MAKYLISETDHLVTSILDSLEVVSAKHRSADSNHIFINFVYNLQVTYSDVLEAISGFIERHRKRLWRLHVTGSEIRTVLEDEEGNVISVQCVIENASGFTVNFHGHQEIQTDKGTTILKPIDEKDPLHLQPVHQSHSTKESLEPKRYQAHLVRKTYVYDFPNLFSKTLRNMWTKVRSFDSSLSPQKKLIQTKELVLGENNQLAEVDRAPGNNTFGIIAWVFSMKTPKYPNWRSVVAVANNIAHKIGSFSPAEDNFSTSPSSTLATAAC